MGNIDKSILYFNKEHIFWTGGCSTWKSQLGCEIPWHALASALWLHYQQVSIRILLVDKKVQFLADGLSIEQCKLV